MDHSDDPTRRKRKPGGDPPEKPLVELKTTNKRLDAVRTIYQRGEVRSIAHDPKLHEKFERARARGTGKPTDDGYKEYGRIRGDLSKHTDFDSKKGKRIHHLDYPRKKHPKESTDTRNLVLTDEKTHKELHKATGGKGFDMYRKKEFLNHPKRSVRDSVKDYFNFLNPKSNVPADQVSRKLELKKRLERAPLADAKRTKDTKETKDTKDTKDAKDAKDAKAATASDRKAAGRKALDRKAAAPAVMRKKKPRG